MSGENHETRNPRLAPGAIFPLNALASPIRVIRAIRGSNAFLRIHQRAARNSGRSRSRLVTRPRATSPLIPPFVSFVSFVVHLPALNGMCRWLPRMSRQNLAQTRVSASSSVPMRSCHAPRRNPQENELCRQKRVSRQNSPRRKSVDRCAQIGSYFEKCQGRHAIPLSALSSLARSAKTPRPPTFSLGSVGRLGSLGGLANCRVPTTLNPIPERTNFHT